MNKKSLRITLAAVAALIPLLAIQSAQAATVYWDTNGATAGSGVTPNGIWGTDAYWSTSSAGTVATSGTGPTSADIAAFSAGFDADASTYTVTLNGTQTVQTAYARSGYATLSGGTLSLTNTTSKNTLYNFQTNGTRTLTVDSTVLVNNTVVGNNFLTFASVNAAGGTITINGILTAANNDATKKIFIRQEPGANTFATNVIFNSNLGTDAGFLTALQAGTITGASAGGTMTFNGAQNLGTTQISGVQAGGTLNLGGTVNTGNAVTLGQILLDSATLNMAGTILNMNSAVTMSSSLNVKNGAALNIAGSVSTGSNNTFLGSATADAFNGGTIKILNGGSATLGQVFVRDSAVFTNAGTLTGTTLTLGGVLNTSGKFVLGDATGVGTATFTGLATVGTGIANMIVGGNSAVSTLTVNTSSASIFNGVIGGAGVNENNVTLVKNGISSLTLGGLNTYTGNTTVNAGTLTLADNGTLAFTIGATGVNNGIGGIGSLTLNGDFTFDLTTAAATGSWNIVDVGSLTATFGTTFSVIGFTDAGGNTWTKINGSSTYTFNEATGLLTAVPEPSTWVLLAGAGTFFMVMRRRRA